MVPYSNIFGRYLRLIHMSCIWRMWLRQKGACIKIVNLLSQLRQRNHLLQQHVSNAACVNQPSGCQMHVSNARVKCTCQRHVSNAACVNQPSGFLFQAHPCHAFWWCHKDVKSSQVWVIKIGNTWIDRSNIRRICTTLKGKLFKFLLRFGNY